MSGPSASGHDAATYGRSFADVYDEWYSDDAATEACVARLAELAGPGGSVLELGVGTGRLALPLAAADLSVTGMDSAPEMLEVLASKLGDAASGVAEAGRAATGGPGSRIRSLLGDAADPGVWPDERFDVVVAATDLLLNLVEPGSQRRCVEIATDHLRPGGHLVVEGVLAEAAEDAERRMEVREVTAERVVLIVTEGRDDGVVVGSHVELRDGEPVRLRPWAVRPLALSLLDSWASAAGLELVSRDADWSDGPFDPDGRSHVSTYRRSPFG